MFGFRRGAYTRLRFEKHVDDWIQTGKRDFGLEGLRLTRAKLLGSLQNLRTGNEYSLHLSQRYHD